MHKTQIELPEGHYVATSVQTLLRGDGFDGSDEEKISSIRHYFEKKITSHVTQ